MPKWIIGVIVVCCLPGCTNQQLRSNTAIQASTLSELQHQIVLKNLAMFACNPYAIPFQANLHDGTAQIADNGSVLGQVSGSRSVLLGAQRTAVDQWSMTPVTDDITLRLLRVAYQRVVPGFNVDLYSNEAELANDLAHELKKQTTTVDDLRTTNQVAQTPEMAQAETVEEVRNAQNEFVDNLAHLLHRDPNMLKRIDEKLTGHKTAFQQTAAAFAEAIGDRNEVEIWTYGQKLAKDVPDCRRRECDAALGTLIAALRHAGDVDNKLIKDNSDYKARSKVADSIEMFVHVLSPGGDQQAERRLAAESLFEVYRSWPEQSQLIGVRHREISSYRIADQKVLSSNRSRIVIPGQKLDDGNLDFVHLPESSTLLIYMQSPRRDRPCEREAQLIACKSDERGNPVILGSINVWENIESNQVQGQADKIFGEDRVIVSGGPLTSSSPIAVSFVGEAPGKPFYERFLHKANQNPDDEIQVKPFHRYMKATPLVIELRRQVMEVGHDLEKIHPGWLGVGDSKHDIPRDACYWACWSECGRRRYVWVCPEDMEKFEDFTIKILNFSSLIKNVNVTGTAGVKYSPATAAPAIR